MIELNSRAISLKTTNNNKIDIPLASTVLKNKHITLNIRKETCRRDLISIREGLLQINITIFEKLKKINDFYINDQN